MPYVPDYIENKFAKAVRNVFIGTGIVGVIIGWLTMGGPNSGFGALTSLGAMMCFLIAYKIKTRRYYRGGGGVYR
ncbi:hypothetical protein [Leisingera caerulea]|uniref:hypothetical protein n=1 Tax=Leisingera caerulea TaxID=506591 RepID=UPI0021A959E4|nr:hypothetical protein [Leisingera caerulea]UWQ83111.1 hypothetical protein K3726_15815 [Leisingera caerulea]